MCSRLSTAYKSVKIGKWRICIGTLRCILVQILLSVYTEMSFPHAFGGNPFFSLTRKRQIGSRVASGHTRLCFAVLPKSVAE